MEINYQVIVDMIANMGIIVFPIALMFVISSKLVNTFISFVKGDKRVKL